MEFRLQNVGATVLTLFSCCKEPTNVRQSSGPSSSLLSSSSSYKRQKDLLEEDLPSPIALTSSVPLVAPVPIDTYESNGVDENDTLALMICEAIRKRVSKDYQLRRMPISWPDEVPEQLLATIAQSKEVKKTITQSVATIYEDGLIPVGVSIFSPEQLAEWFMVEYKKLIQREGESRYIRLRYMRATLLDVFKNKETDTKGCLSSNIDPVAVYGATVCRKYGFLVLKLEVSIYFDKKK